MISKPFSKNLVSGGSSSQMAVDGSSTPVEFKIEADADADKDIHKISLMVELGDVLALSNKFLIAAIGTLANGLTFDGQVGGLSFAWPTCKRTRDILALGAFQVETVGSNALLRVELYLPPDARLCKQGTVEGTDFLRATVSDNLTALTRMECFVQGTKL